MHAGEPNPTESVRFPLFLAITFIVVDFSKLISTTTNGFNSTEAIKSERIWALELNMSQFDAYLQSIPE